MSNTSNQTQRSPAVWTAVRKKRPTRGYFVCTGVNDPREKVIRWGWESDPNA